MTNKALAQSLFISEHTLRVYIEGARMKLADLGDRLAREPGDDEGLDPTGLLSAHPDYVHALLHDRPRLIAWSGKTLGMLYHLDRASYSHITKFQLFKEEAEKNPLRELKPAAPAVPTPVNPTQ